MMEKFKTALLVFLVLLSLLQTYLLSYEMPSFGIATRSDSVYVNAELLGKMRTVEDIIFPSELVVHLGNDEHTIIYPKTQFYELIISQRLANREFKGFQIVSNTSTDWEQMRRQNKGIELSFYKGISFDLLTKILKLDTEGLLMTEKILIHRILVYADEATEEVKAYFFDQQSNEVYEAVRVDLTVKDIQDYVGFGQYMPRYEYVAEELYLALEPIQTKSMVYEYEVISPEQMQRSLFFDSSSTRAFVNRSGSQIYTDGKRGLQVEQNGLWITYTNSAASQSSNHSASENVYAAIDFVNQHGGWDTSYQFVSHKQVNDLASVDFRKYVDQFPVIDISPFKYGFIELNIQQGVVMEYERTMIKLPVVVNEKAIRWLYGGEQLRAQIEAHPLKEEIKSVFAALKAVPYADNTLKLEPIWAIRLEDGSEAVLMEAIPQAIDPNQIYRDKVQVNESGNEASTEEGNE